LCNDLEVLSIYDNVLYHILNWTETRGAGRLKIMDLTLTIPDDIAQHLGTPVELERKALETFALEEFKRGHLTRPELRRLLGFETRYELDGFLVSHGVFGTFTEADLARQREGMQRLGF
jgi:Uncharacterised protein family (UPF0175)